MGDVMGDMNRRRARILGMEPVGHGVQKLMAEAPMAELLDYPIALEGDDTGEGFLYAGIPQIRRSPSSSGDEDHSGSECGIEKVRVYGDPDQKELPQRCGGSFFTDSLSLTVLRKKSVFTIINIDKKQVKSGGVFRRFFGTRFRLPAGRR